MGRPCSSSSMGNHYGSVYMIVSVGRSAVVNTLPLKNGMLSATELLLSSSEKYRRNCVRPILLMAPLEALLILALYQPVEGSAPKAAAPAS